MLPPKLGEMFGQERVNVKEWRVVRITLNQTATIGVADKEEIGMLLLHFTHPSSFLLNFQIILCFKNFLAIQKEFCSQ